MKKKYLAILIIILNLVIIPMAFADGEEDTFSSQDPDVLIILDGSWSMGCNTSQDSNQTTKYGPSDCSGSVFTAYNFDPTHYTTDCSKIAIARRSIGIILDEQKAKRKIRMGFMGFNNCSPTSLDAKGNALNAGSGGAYNYNDPNKGCNYIRNGISDSWTDSSTNIFESIRSSVNSLAAGGNTPVVASLAEAKKYFKAYSDDAKKCRAKFVILITDGDDTLACSGATGESQQKDQYKRRRESVAAAKALYDAYADVTDNPELKAQKIKVFVIGFGSNMPSWLQNTLNWMAYYGQTSFSQTHTGDYNAYELDTTNPVDLYPYDSTYHKITACQTSTTNPASGGICNGTTLGCMAADTMTDPGANLLTGYAFMATDPASLNTALASAFKVIEETYSFATSSVQSVRTKDENYIYEASFTVRTNDPFYVGHLKQYKINEDGTIPTDFQWDAGAVLKTTDASARNIWTYKSGAAIAFSGDGTTSGNINYTDLGVTGATAAADAGKIITFIRGGDVTADTADPFYQWKLGDTFHSFPVTIGTPATYFCDNVDSTTGACCNNVDCKNPLLCNPIGSCCPCLKAFDLFRGNHQRTTTTGNKDRMIVIGANDGQLHLFSTYDGEEKWSFIPPNLLSRLQYVSHQIHPDTRGHTYFVDGPISVSDIWFPADSTYTIEVAKLYSDWHTWMVFSEGRGAKNTLWSSSTSSPCASGLSKYSSVGSNTFPYYCGYYAFDLTSVTRASSTPSGPKWLLNISSTDAPYLGEPWSKMVMSRVRRDGNEKWVGFIGGGYSDCLTLDNPTCATRGKGFFVVDLETGSVIKRFSSAIASTTPPVTPLAMGYQLPAPPAAVDIDNDSFVDTVYMGDLGNNIWRFKMCLKTDDAGSPKCGMGTTGKWISTALLSSSNHNRKIFTQASVTRDNAGNVWVYVGTGDKMRPTANTLTYKDRLYAIKDNDLSSTWTLTDLKDITSTTYCTAISASCTATNVLNDAQKHGWYIDLGGNDSTHVGEKILADPVVFQGIVYFSTYVPPAATDVCDTSGSAYLYAIDYVTGAGRFSGDTPRYEFIGYGIPSSPIVSLNPYGGTDVYVSTSQKNTQTLDTFVKKQSTPIITNYNKTNLMMWLDKRVQ